MEKEALPTRYVVDRKGAPDPEASQYYVLDVVHDRHARAVLGRLVSYYRQFGQMVAADELASLLETSTDAHREVIQRQSESALAASSSTARSRRKTAQPQGRM